MIRMPVVVAEVAFDVDPKTRPASDQWVPLAAEGEPLLRTFETVRGAPVRESDTEAGTAGARVDNRTRALDPTNEDGPFWPNVKPRKRVRFFTQGTDVLTDYLLDYVLGEPARLLFTGFLEHIPPSWIFHDGWVDLTCVDLFGLIADETLPPSALQADIMSDGRASNYWPLGETVGNYADDVIGTCDGTWQVPARGDGPPIPWDPRPSQLMSIATSDGRVPGQWVTTHSVPFADSFSLSFWFRYIGQSEGTQYDIRILTAWADPLDDPALQITLDTNHKFRVIVGSRDFLQTDAILGLRDGGWHHLLFEFDGDLTSGGDTGLGFLTLDGSTKQVLGGFAGGTKPGAFVASKMLIGPHGATPETNFDWKPELVSIQHVELYQQTVGAALGARRYNSGVFAWDGDKPGERLNRILDAIGIDPDDRDIDTGTQTCGPTMLNSQNVMAYIRKINATEGGSCFVNADGKICLRERVANDPTPTFTISDDPVGDDGSPYVVVSPDYSLDRIVNIAEVTREAGDTLRSTNQDSVTAYGPRTVKLDTLHRSPAAARGRGAALTNRFSDPRLVVESLELASRRADTPMTLTLDTELRDVGRLIMRPTGGGDPIEQLVIVERLEQRMDALGHWTTQVGVAEHLVLPTLAWDTTDRGWDESVWADA